MSADLKHPSTEIEDKNVLVPNLIAAIIFATAILVLLGPLIMPKIFDGNHIAVPLGIMMASGPLLVGVWHLCRNLVTMWRDRYHPERTGEHFHAAIWMLLLCAAFAVVLGIAATLVAMMGGHSWWLWLAMQGWWYVPLGAVPVVAYATMLYRLLIAKSMGWTLLWAGVSLSTVWFLASEATYFMNHVYR